MGRTHITQKNRHSGAARKSKSRREAAADSGVHVEAERVLLEKRKDDDGEAIPDTCYTGGFYVAPQIGETIDALAPLNVTWNPSCLSTKLIDIYLYAPGNANPRIHYWQKIPFSKGSFELELLPRWWNAKTEQNLQLNIVPHGQPVFMSELPAGPIFKATFTPPKEGEEVPAALDTNMINVETTIVGGDEKGMNPGKTAAAVLVPLILLALAILAFFKWKRSRGLEKRKTWAEAVDKRMSTISTDWKSVSAAGAQAAIRNSMAVNGTGRSSFSFGNIRPSSQFERDAAWDEKGGEYGGVDNSQRRPGVGLRNPSGLGMGERASTATRVSRVSFANDPRPSSESRRTKTFRDSYVPPVPVLPVNTSNPYRRPSQDEESEGGTAGTMSPTQTVGAMTLTPEDIRARIAAGRARAESNAASSTRKTSFERDVTDQDGEVLPALKMMRTNDTHDDYLLAQQPAPPAPAYPKPVTSHSTSDSTSTPMSPTLTAQPMSPVMQSMPMPMQPATVMSPDDMLRAYAERKKSMGSAISPGSIGVGPVGSTMGVTGTTGAAISYPQPAANTSGGGRTLFNGNALSPNNTGGSGKEPSLGFAPGEYDANFSFGGQASGGYAVGGGDGEEDVTSGNAAGRGAYGAAR